MASSSLTAAECTVIAAMDGVEAPGLNTLHLKK
jgi:hypothetical protein